MRAQRRWTRAQGGAGLVLLAGCAAILTFGGGLAAGFAAMAALLLGAALTLPPALSLLLRMGQRAARGPIAEWFWADARREMSGVSLALMALLLALGANIGVGSMVGGFRAVFTGWLEQRLAADLYLNAPPERLEEATTFLRSRADVDAALPTASVETRIESWPIEVEGLTDHPLYRASWPVLGAPADWDAVARGEAGLVSEQTARRFGLRAGDTVTLPTPAGDWELMVAGIYADYGNPRGQAAVALDALQDHWPEARPSGLEIVVADGATAEIVAALRAEFGAGLGPMLDQQSIKRLSLSIFERTFAVTAALNVLTLAVAGAALLASLAALAQQRLSQLAPVWALGVTRRALARLELGKTLALAALTAVLAVPLGVALAWLLVAVINVEAFGWRLPLHVFPLQWIWLFALALLAALLAGAGPALQLARTSPARLASVFANER
jgi:putative ABC transport system permease protein